MASYGTAQANKFAYENFYDLWFLSRRYSFTYATLKEAITRTFSRRGTDTKEYATLKTDSYQKVQQTE